MREIRIVNVDMALKVVFESGGYMQPMEHEQPQSLRALFAKAEQERKSLESAPHTASSSFQENLTTAILTFEECLRVADRISLFSPNETLDDIASGDLRYLLLNYQLAELILKTTARDRKAVLRRAQLHFERYLKLLDDYDALSKGDAGLYERFKEDRDGFSTASKTDATARRETKIARFREEKELKRKLELLQRDPSLEHNDEAIVRELYLTQMAFAAQQTFQSLESIAQELEILTFVPPPTSNGAAESIDPRHRNGRGDGFSERLDSPMSQLKAGLNGPILDKDGRPLRPFTLLDNRTRMQQGVFRPDHSLPTMSIDEYLEEEKRRGGIIEGGGPQSGVQPEPDEDNIEKADEELVKARAWDDYKEENPRGSGNTMNMG